ncbi:hypothetical protein GGI25_004639 [Coemansia spiralis]|uniref:Uncharacterized protein n=2 Tax=Coemansia TaxID=4863 RepID=A0A9W8G482_9FUNG|nr:hypothetical protein EDC05_004563 [Coemansia umbellata]KAJ2620414.1 hypothetical protein GGI26_004984 [Coemansia sp. RSA 1358]KAJ2673654.1 hypothetical protein GGI25_004639 [Coemansia spiralis]
MGNPKRASNREQAQSDKSNIDDKKLVNELEELRALALGSYVPIEQQYDMLSEAEQTRTLQRMLTENEADIKTFSAFLKLPTVVLLMLNLAFAYNYALSGFGSTSAQRKPMLPFIGYELHTDHPILATEISVLIVQFALYLLSSRRWDMLVQYGIIASFVSCFGHVLLSHNNGLVELLWWMLPVLNLVVVCYAQFNMRRSRHAIESLAERVPHVKND